MRLYRISFSTVEESHYGYQYCSSREAANRCIATVRRESGYGRAMRAVVETFELIPKKGDILRYLNLFGGHADNG